MQMQKMTCKPKKCGIIDEQTAFFGRSISCPPYFCLWLCLKKMNYPRVHSVGLKFI